MSAVEWSDGGDVRAKIDGAADEGYKLWWTDGLEEWTEEYGFLSFALLRLGALVACGEQGWEPGFQNDQEEFALDAGAFLLEQVQ